MFLLAGTRDSRVYLKVSPGKPEYEGVLFSLKLVTSGYSRELQLLSGLKSRAISRIDLSTVDASLGCGDTKISRTPG